MFSSIMTSAGITLTANTYSAYKAWLDSTTKPISGICIPDVIKLQFDNDIRPIIDSEVNSTVTGTSLKGLVSTNRG